jgi:hypothetical protein
VRDHRGNKPHLLAAASRLNSSDNTSVNYVAYPELPMAIAVMGGVSYAPTHASTLEVTMLTTTAKALMLILTVGPMTGCAASIAQLKESQDVDGLINVCVDNERHSECQLAVDALVKIGKPAVPRLAQFVEKGTMDTGASKASYAALVLGGIGADASEAVPTLVQVFPTVSFMADSSDENAHSDFDSVPPTLRQFKVVQTQDRVSYYISNAGVPMDTQNYAFASVRRLTIYFVGADALQKITGQGFGQDWAAWTHWWKTKNPSARLAIDSSWADWPMPNGPADVVAGAPNPDSYTDNRDGTVTDNVTGLMWQQTVPSIHDFPFGCPWADAVAYCQTLTLASYSDWRLPSRIELVSLVDEERYDARTIGRLSIDPTYFPNTPGTHYFWSSSPRKKEPFT